MWRCAQDETFRNSVLGKDEMIRVIPKVMGVSEEFSNMDLWASNERLDHRWLDNPKTYPHFQDSLTFSSPKIWSLYLELWYYTIYLTLVFFERRPQGIRFWNVNDKWLTNMIISSCNKSNGLIMKISLKAFHCDFFEHILACRMLWGIYWYDRSTTSLH